MTILVDTSVWSLALRRDGDAAGACTLYSVIVLLTGGLRPTRITGIKRAKAMVAAGLS